MVNERLPAKPADAMAWTSFDRFARYTAIADCVRANLGDDELTVLEVGDSAGYLTNFAPRLNVVSVDVHLTPDPLPGTRRLWGDGMRLPISTGAVDVAVSSDVLEHIPPPERAAFCEELRRVARQLVVIAAPFDTVGVASAERFVATYAQQAMGVAQAELAEHAEHGLPVLDDVMAEFEKSGWHPVSAGNGNLSDWVALMVAKFQLSSRSSLRPLADAQDRVYNQLLAHRNDVAPFYRHVVIASPLNEPKTPAPRRSGSANDGALLSALTLGSGPDVVREDNLPQFNALTKHVLDAVGVLHGDAEGVFTAVNLVHGDAEGLHEQIVQLHHRVSALHNHVDSAAAMLHGDAEGIYRITGDGTNAVRAAVASLREMVSVQDAEIRLLHEKLDRLLATTDRAVAAARHPLRGFRSWILRR